VSNNINVTVGADAVTVFDSPSAIELSVDIGETGAPGSQIYVVNVKDPNDPAQLTYIDGYPYVGSRKVNVGDILINYDTSPATQEDPDRGFPKIHQYAVLSGGTRAFSLVFSMRNLITAAAYPNVLDAISFDELLTYLDHSDHVNITTQADLPNNKLIFTATLEDTGIIEQVEDIVSNMFDGTQTGVTVTYSDEYGTLSIAVQVEFVQDTVAAMFDGVHTNLTATYNDTLGKITLAVPNENIQDASATLVNHSSHTGITAVYDDANNKILLTGLTQENVEDFVGSMFDTEHTDIIATYDDETGKLTLSAAYGDEAIQDISAALLDHELHVNISVNYDDAENKVILTGTYGQTEIINAIKDTLVHESHQNISVVYDDEGEIFIFSFASNIQPGFSSTDTSVGSIGGAAPVIIQTVQIESDQTAITAIGTIPYLSSTATADRYKIVITESDSETTVGTEITAVTGLNKSGNTVSATWAPQLGTRYVHLAAQRVSGTGTFIAYAGLDTISNVNYGDINISVRTLV
jgi:hypothetical protein